MLRQHWRSILRVLFPGCGLLALFLPWLSLDVHGPMSGIDLMIYVIDGDDRMLFWRLNWLSTLALLVLAPIIILASQTVILGLYRDIKLLEVAAIAIGATALLLWATPPLLAGGDSTQTFAIPGVGLILLVVVMLASVVLQLISPAGLSRRPRISKRIKNALYNEFDGRCALCGDRHDIGNLEIDHIQPRAHGGADDYANYQLLCGRCNRLKGTKTNSEARKRLAETRG